MSKEGDCSIVAWFEIIVLCRAIAGRAQKGNILLPLLLTQRPRFVVNHKATPVGLLCSENRSSMCTC